MTGSGRRVVGALLALWLLLPMGCVQRAAPPEVSDTPEMRDLRRLAQVFYTRISNRRFNSISTFHDPALREFFQSPEAFSDYYADLADALANANFEYNRPDAVSVEGMEPDGQDRVRMEVLFVGQNGKPLPYHHGFHQLPNKIFTTKYVTMGVCEGRDGFVNLLVMHPYTLLRIKIAR